MSIRHVSLDHGWFYFYRLHETKTDNLTKEFPELGNYLKGVFEGVPDEYFRSGPRSSHLKFPLQNLKLQPVEEHEVMDLSTKGLEINEGRYKSNHSKVQVFMLEHDDNTLAVEVPLWLHPEELENYNEIFDSDIPLTGHIDVLRIEDGKIVVWDYKPNARREKYASTQVYFYALMLSVRTGIPLNKFVCGYFDSHNSYMFNPVDVTPHI